MLLGNEFGHFDLDDVDPSDPPDDPFAFFCRDFFGMSGNSCGDDSVPRLEFRFRLPLLDGSRPGDSVERFDERWRLDCFSLPFGEPKGESLPIDGLRLDFFCFSLPRGGNESRIGCRIKSELRACLNRDWRGYWRDLIFCWDFNKL